MCVHGFIHGFMLGYVALVWVLCTREFESLINVHYFYNYVALIANICPIILHQLLLLLGNNRTTYGHTYVSTYVNIFMRNQQWLYNRFCLCIYLWYHPWTILIDNTDENECNSLGILLRWHMGMHWLALVLCTYV